MDPSLCPLVSAEYGSEYAFPATTYDEIDTLISSDSDGLNLPIRDRINEHLRSLKHHRVPVSEFTQLVTPGIQNMYDLLDIETFIRVFPGELFFLIGEADYKPSLARKLALTAVKKWVNGQWSPNLQEGQRLGE